MAGIQQSRPEARRYSTGAPADCEAAPEIAKPEERSATTNPDDAYPKGIKLALLLLAVFVNMFLVALDRLIISTAIPQITDDFHSVTDIGWYGSAYLLTNCAFQLLFGKIYVFFSIKFTFLSAVLLFEVGSAICGAAPNSVAFILGRAIAGVGSAGIMSGTLVIIVYAIPLQKRPMYPGIFGAVFGLSSIVGPLLGGVFTTEVTWRWCFYINLPFGGVAMVFLFLLLKIPDREATKSPLMIKFSQLDILGTGILMPGVICLLLALQWGGSTYAWSKWRIILLLTLSGVLLLAFVSVQILMPRTATVPPRMVLQRSILAGLYCTLCIGSQMMIFIYFLPIWFQAIKGLSAMDSGIRLLPLVLAMVVSSVMTGVLTTKIGYYTPFLIMGVCIMAVGSGLLTTLQVDTGEAKWIGYQVLFGWGLGNSFQAPNLAAQTILPTDDVPIGTSLMLFSQLLGGTNFISVGQNLLGNQLLERLRGIPGLDPTFLQDQGATTITELPGSIRPTVISAYNEALRDVFRVGLIMSCLTVLGALAMEWRSVKNKALAGDEAGKDVAEKDEGETKKGKE